MADNRINDESGIGRSWLLKVISHAIIPMMATPNVRIITAAMTKNA